MNRPRRVSNTATGTRDGAGGSGTRRESSNTATVLFRPDLASSQLRNDRHGGAFALAMPHETTTGRPIEITQDDVRSVQLAKGAFRASIEIVLKRAGIGHIDGISMAGTFGNYIERRYAMVLGLLPEVDLDAVRSVGNAAGDGARVALLNISKRREATRLARESTYIETAIETDFRTSFSEPSPSPTRRRCG